MQMWLFLIERQRRRAVLSQITPLVSRSAGLRWATNHRRQLIMSLFISTINKTSEHSLINPNPESTMKMFYQLSKEI